jgi:hypothetical protein
MFLDSHNLSYKSFQYEWAISKWGKGDWGELLGQFADSSMPFQAYYCCYMLCGLRKAVIPGFLERGGSHIGSTSQGVVEHLHKALSSVASTAKKKKKNSIAKMHQNVLLHMCPSVCLLSPTHQCEICHEWRDRRPSGAQGGITAMMVWALQSPHALRHQSCLTRCHPLITNWRVRWMFFSPGVPLCHPKNHPGQMHPHPSTVSCM